MAFVFERSVATPLWAIAFFAVALTAPQPATLLLPSTTLLVIAAVAIAAIAFSMPGAIPWLRTSRTLVCVRPSAHGDHVSAVIVAAAGTCVRTVDEPNQSERDDALEFVRMDDSGGWQMPRPPA
jgi:hypothetical protein